MIGIMKEVQQPVSQPPISPTSSEQMTPQTPAHANSVYLNEEEPLDMFERANLPPLHLLLVRLLQTRSHKVPIHYIPPRLNIVISFIFVIEIVGVLPDIKPEWGG